MLLGQSTLNEDGEGQVRAFCAFRGHLFSGVPQPNAAPFGPLTSESRLADGQTGPYSIANHTPLALTEGNHSR